METKKLSQLPVAETIANTKLLGTNGAGQSVAVPVEILIKEIKIKQEQLTGEVDGTNKTFMTSAPYVAGSISVFVNGLKQRGITETSNTTVTLADAPLNTGDFEDVVEAIYMQNN